MVRDLGRTEGAGRVVHHRDDQVREDPLPRGAVEGDHERDGLPGVGPHPDEVPVEDDQILERPVDQVRGAVRECPPQDRQGPAVVAGEEEEGAALAGVVARARPLLKPGEDLRRERTGLPVVGRGRAGDGQAADEHPGVGAAHGAGPVPSVRGGVHVSPPQAPSAIPGLSRVPAGAGNSVSPGGRSPVAGTRPRRTSATWIRSTRVRGLNGLVT